MGAIAAGRRMLFELVLSPSEAAAHGLKVSQDGVRRNGFTLLAFPDIGFDDLLRVNPTLSVISEEVRNQIERDALYAQYLDRQAADIDQVRRDEGHEIPEDFDYANLSGLSAELSSKLSRIRPRTLSQAGRVDGMTPAALTLILARLKKADRQRSAG
jgi:tRNA uridine 5-carboxymethylaminomethyl modification enzyme